MTTQLLTTEEVAKRLGASVLTIRRWVRDGRLPAIRSGGRFIRLDWDEVIDALKARVHGIQRNTAIPLPPAHTEQTESDSLLISKHNSKLASNLPMEHGAHGD